MQSMKKISVISDTHGIIEPKIIPSLLGSDMIIHAGDIMSISILNELESYSDNVVAVAGNNHPSHNDLRSSYPNSKLIIYGHTHNQICDQTKYPWVVNPGAAGHTRNNDGGPCFMQIHINKNNWEIKSHCIK